MDQSASPIARYAAPVAIFAPPPPPPLDSEPLVRMIAALGPQAATQRLDRGREDLMHRLDRLQTAHRAHELRSVLSDAMATADLAGELGLSDLHRVALDVAGCAGRNDGAALSATLARLLRLGEHAADRIAALGPAAG